MSANDRYRAPHLPSAAGGAVVSGGGGNLDKLEMPELTAAELAQSEEALRKLIDETPNGARRRLLKNDLRNVVANRMTAERRSS